MRRVAQPLLALLVSSVILLVPACAASAAPPAIPAVWVTAVGAESAVLRTEINPQGQSTSYRFEYLTLAAYEENLAAGRGGFEGARAVPTPAGLGIGAGAAPVAVAFTLIAPLNPLAPATPYRFRVVAESAGGTTASTPHAMHTEANAPSPGLPDQRAWELVSPVDKGGGAVAGPGQLFDGGAIQAASGGGALTYGSATAFADPSGAPPISQYLSTRGPAGWSTVNLSGLAESGGYGDQPDGAPFQVFSTDLGQALVRGGRRCVPEGTCPPSYSLRTAGGTVAELPSAPGLRFEGATADLHHLLFGSENGLYVWSGEALELVSGAIGATLAAPIGAVSEDGSRVYFTSSGGGPIYLFEAGSGTRLLPETEGGGAAFQAASADGSLAYFSRGGQLYRYTVAAGASTSIAAGVVGVLAVSADGSRIYYQDGSGLQLWQDGATRQIAAWADASLPSDYPPAGATVRLSADGGILAFLSAAAIGEYDNVDAQTGQPDTEVYLYDAGADALLCASCNPTGERPNGSALIPGALQNGTTTSYRPRALSADGRRLFFTTADSLLGSDTNSVADVYQWEARGEGDCAEAPGCVRLISAGRGEGGRFLDASADGADVYFLTGDSLVGADPGSIDAYDARVGGGLPEVPGPIPCIADACQSLPSAPEDPSPGSSVTGAANPSPHYFKEGRRHRGGKHRKKHHKHRQRRHADRGRAAR